ncbi:hypothetical protein AVV36_gp144 [Pectobacterium bacteriophage PM2]|uniref:Uncharacterized protein n=1 Tax=Pectobacterium bacteriophage PM2 TaxID=1429794 RepID=A0A0A0Q0G5_9CAUD|nr:hypothetical protein AVV36_gp144 [Pectobacterium bacteriophage PM2]AHY25106.1 hypothetical protein PM2_144 [Pectobacterium bacteriophage PM2]
MNPKNQTEIIKKIPLVIDKKSAQEAIKALLEPVDLERAERLADQYGVYAHMGEYGDGGKTYYPKGTNVKDNYICEYALSNNNASINEDGELESGVWISSSEMC